MLNCKTKQSNSELKKGKVIEIHNKDCQHFPCWLIVVISINLRGFHHMEQGIRIMNIFVHSIINFQINLFEKLQVVLNRLIFFNGPWEWKDFASLFLVALYGGWAGIDMVLRLVRYPNKQVKIEDIYIRSLTQLSVIQGWYLSKKSNIKNHNQKNNRVRRGARSSIKFYIKQSFTDIVSVALTFVSQLKKYNTGVGFCIYLPLCGRNIRISNFKEHGYF